MTHLTESQKIRKSLTLLEGVSVDKNGLRLSNSTDSGYYLVSMLSWKNLTGKFIAYANVYGDEQQARKLDFERSQGGSLVPGYFGHKNVIGLTVEDNVLDAAYIAQTFSNDLENNLNELFDGNLSVIPKSPGNWQHEPDVSAIDRIEKAKNRKPRVMKPKAPKIKDAQGALLHVWKDNKDSYTMPKKEEMATLRKEVNSLKDEMGWIDAAISVLEKYKK